MLQAWMLSRIPGGADGLEQLVCDGKSLRGSAIQTDEGSYRFVAKVTAYARALGVALWGLDEGLRVLERLPDWCSHARSDKARASKMLRHATSLRYIIDITVMRCYSEGRRPTILEGCKYACTLGSVVESLMPVDLQNHNNAYLGRST